MKDHYHDVFSTTRAKGGYGTSYGITLGSPNSGEIGATCTRSWNAIAYSSGTNDRRATSALGAPVRSSRGT